MYTNNLAGYWSGVPPMNMAGLGIAIGYSKEKAALLKQKTWSRADWAAFFGAPLGYQQQQGFAQDYSTKMISIPQACSGFGRFKTCSPNQSQIWGKIQPTLKAEYKAALAVIDAQKKAASEKVVEEKLQTEQAVKQDELATKIKESETIAQSSITDILNKFEFENAEAKADGKILGMNKKTAMIAGGVAAGGILLLIMNN